MILVLNAGSSTWKCALFKIGADTVEIDPAWEGFLDFGQSKETLLMRVTARGKAPLSKEIPSKQRKSAVQDLISTAWQGNNAVIASPEEITKIGHRVVHGGEKFVEPTLVTKDVKEAIRSLSELAPLHNPSNLEGIEIMEALLPSCPQIAVFDTAFHRTMPEAAQTYAIPLEWRKEGIRRYGFHGISHAYCAKRAAELLGKELYNLNLITCHLGNGSSLTAIRQGKSFATTMGFTPMEGMVMGTRSGTVDPGIIFHLLKEKKTSEELEKAFNNASGLKALCGTADMRDLLAMKKQGSTEAQLAFDIYIHQLCWHIGALLGCMSVRTDALVFAGGIGENAADIRLAACERFKTFGMEIDPERNGRGGIDRELSVPGSRIPILVIKTREELEIARASLGIG
ncbi:MAG: acetate kinase [Parachlamydia sp.]|nr:acetate kinase [Parachlamydia sp.]